MWSDEERKEVYKELRPLNAYDIAANETWLEDLAREGFHLTGFSGTKGVFERGKPAEHRYRMQLAAKKEPEPSEERITRNNALGWTYVATWDDRFHIWKNEQRNMTLDPAYGLDEDDFRRLRRNLLWKNFWWTVFTIAAIAFAVWAFLSLGSPLRSVVYGSFPGVSVLLLLSAVTAVIEGVYAIVLPHRMLRILEEREPIPRPRSYRKQQWMARIIFLVGIMWTIYGALDTFRGDPWDAYDETHDYPVAEAVYADLREIEGRGDDEVAFFGPKTKTHDLAPRMWFIRQASVEVDYRNQTAVSSEYYHMLSEALVSRMERELVEEKISDQTGGKITGPEKGDLDAFWWDEHTRVDDRREQNIVAVRGRNIMAVEYVGPIDLRSQADYFARLLAE